MTTNRFDPATTLPPEHVERVGERMRDTTELDNLRDDTYRNLAGQPVNVPWRTGRPLRSAGMNAETGTPVTPLAALDLTATVLPEVADRLARELQRAATADRVSEGILDHAQRLGVPLTEEEQWWEAQQRQDLQLQEQGAGDPAQPLGRADPTQPEQPNEQPDDAEEAPDADRQPDSPDDVPAPPLTPPEEDVSQ